MKRNRSIYALCAGLAVAGAILSIVPTHAPAYGQVDPTAGQAGGGTGSGVAPGAAAGGGAGRRGGRGPIADPNSSLVNLAMVAKASTSFVSGDQTLSAINDGQIGGRGGAANHYGNWPRGGTQWVEYQWPKAISTNKADVLWWADGGGIHLPAASRIKYWDGTGYVEVPNAKGLGVEGNAFNTTSFDEVKTERIRLEFDAEGGPQISTGITEFRVFDSGHSPALPPIVKAGMERVTVTGGKTYLNGEVKELKTGDGNGSAGIRWSKVSGPGNVTFADAAAPITTATFDKVGEYVLKLGATRDDMNSGDTVTVKVEYPAPDMALTHIATTPYQIDSPLWNARLKAHIVTWIPHVVEFIEHPEEHIDARSGQVQGPGGLDNMIEAAKKLRGEPAARHKGYVFSNAWVHNTMESMCQALLVDPHGDQEIIDAQAKLRQKVDEWVPIIIAAQEPDGYIQTAFTLSGHAHWDPRYRGDHEGYTMGYFLESGIAHYIMTKGQDRRLYEAAKKCADCWVDNIGLGKKDWYDGHQEMEQALVRFGRFVNEVEGPGKGEKYIALAKFLLDARYSDPQHRQPYDQSQSPMVQQYEAVGHAVRASYTYSALSAVMAETRDVDYQSASLSLWDNIVNKKYYVTGGIGSGETSEGFGPNYSLRNNAYCESCSGTGELFFQHNMQLAFQDGKYADLLEDTLFNAVLGDTNLQGTLFNYTNPLESGGQTGGRTAWHACPCCVGNIPRTLLQLPTWMYSTGKDTICVSLFAGSTVNIEKFMGTSVEMVQKTNYPWDGNVSITVNPKMTRTFALRVRVPDRSVSEIYSSTPDSNGVESIKVNGAAITPRIEKGYAVINREWKAGDTVDIVLPMKAQRVKAIDQVAADRGRVALRYGPLVYNIETVDQEGGNSDRVLAPDSPLTTEWKPDLLGGVVVIKGTWADGTPLVAIPNYARNNRGGRSMVWIRDQ